VAVLGEVQFLAVNVAASGNTTLVAAQGAGVKIRVLSLCLVAAAAVVAQLQSGAGGTGLTGPMTLATGKQISAARAAFGLLETAPNALLNLNLGGAVQVSGFLVWVTAQ
jgi:hypothetical protein